MTKTETSTFRAIVPKRLRQKILELAHSSAGGGHFGVQKTINKLKQRFHWNRMTRDVRDWCEKCPTCNRHKTQQQNRAPMQPIYTGEPFERVAMDIIGPLPKTERGNRYILTVVDHFTKHVEAYALADQEAATVARVFLNEFVSRYGVPYVLHSDQGSNFESNLFKELCQMLNIKKTRTTPYHPQCDGQVERMNRTIIDLLKLNIRDPTNNWDMNIGLALMAYRSAVQTSTNYTPYFLLYGREMRLPLDVMYRPPERDQSRTEYAIEVRKTLDQAYEVTREHLKLAHKRQKDYYDRRTRGQRFKHGDSVWLHTPVLEKGVAPKFHEPWTGPFKVKKQLSDVTYEIEDMANKTSKVVHFDRLKRATVKPRIHKLSESELETSSSSAEEDDLSDYAPVKRPPTVKPVKPQVDATIPQLPPVAQHPRIPKTQNPESGKEAPKAAPKTPEALKKTSQATLEKPETAQTGNDQAMAPAAAKAPKEKKGKSKAAAPPLAAEHPTRHSERSNKGVPPPRLGYTSAILIIALLPLLFATAFGQDVIQLPSYGAIAEQCGTISLDEGPSMFSMVMRLELPKENVNNTDNCYGYTSDIVKEDNEIGSIPSWMDTNIISSGTNSETEKRRKRRFLPLLLGIGAVASAILSAGTAIYTTEQLREIKARMSVIDSHLSSLTTTVTEQHDQLVTITTATDSLYEYTHENFRKLSEKLINLECQQHFELEYLTRRTRMKARLYADFECAITAVFSGHPTPILLPPSAIKELMKNNEYWFKNTIYQTDFNFIYQYGYVHPVIPIRYGKIGYVLGLPRILKAEQTPLYCIRANAVIHKNKIYKYNLPPYAINVNQSLKALAIWKCQQLIFNEHLCSENSDVSDIPCLQNQSTCDVQIKTYNETQVRVTQFGLLIATKANCSKHTIGHKISIAKTENGAYFIPYNFSGAIVCSDGTSIPSADFKFDYTVKYTEPYMHLLPQELDDYNVEEWTDYKQLKSLETGLAKQVIERYTTFSNNNNHWIWPILAIALIILYSATISGIIYCWCKTCRKIKRIPIRTIDHVVEYVPANSQEQVPSTSSNLQANENAKLYPEFPGATSILKTNIQSENKNRSRSADAVRAIFHPEKKEEKRIQLDY